MLGRLILKRECDAIVQVSVDVFADAMMNAIVRDARIKLPRTLGLTQVGMTRRFWMQYQSYGCAPTGMIVC